MCDIKNQILENVRVDLIHSRQDSLDLDAQESRSRLYYSDGFKGHPITDQNSLIS